MSALIAVDIAMWVVAYFLAKSKGRSPWAWVGWTLLGGLISLIILLFKPDLSSQSDYHFTN